MKSLSRAAIAAVVAGVSFLGQSAAGQIMLPGSIDIYIDGRNLGFGTANPESPVHILTRDTHGCRVYNNRTSGRTWGFFSQVRSSRGTGVYGYARSRTGRTFGVYGRVRSTNGRGVFGIAQASRGLTYGVYGISESNRGTGVQGECARGTGVRGETRTGAAIVGECTGDGFSGFFAGGPLVCDSRVGVGTPDPEQPLHVYGDCRVENGQMYVNATSQDVAFADQSQLFVSSSLGFPFYVQRQNRQQLFYVDFDGTAFARDFGAISDERTKKNIEPITDGLETVLALEGVSFEWRDEQPGAGSGTQIGLIAQQVERVLPEAVIETPDGYKGVRYANLVSVLIEATKTQQDEIEAARAEADAARAENAALREALAALLERVEALEAE